MHRGKAPHVRHCNCCMQRNNVACSAYYRGWWSIASALNPVAAKIGLPFLLVVRAFMGIGKGVALSAMNNILSKWVSDAFSQSGLYSNHHNIVPCYSGMLLGLSNTAGILAGVFGTAATGYISRHGLGSWNDVFLVSVGLYLAGTVVWNVFSTCEKIPD